MAKDSMGVVALRQPARASGISSLPQRLRQRAEQAADTPFGTPISLTEQTRTEAARALAAFRAQTQPATDDGRKALAAARGACLFRLADIVGKPDALRNADEAQQVEFWAPYHDILAPIPIPVLERATRAYMAQPAGKGGKWFPDPGTLLALANADDAWADERRVAKGLDRLASAKVSRDMRPPLSADEEARLWAEYTAKREALSAKVAAEIEEVKGADDGFLQRVRETGSLYKAVRT